MMIYSIAIEQMKKERDIYIMKKRIVCILLALALCHYGELPVSAAREEELQAEKEENTRKLTDINEKVNDLEYQKQQMLSDIDTLDQKLVSVLAQIELLDEQITGKKNEITETDAKRGAGNLQHA